MMIGACDGNRTSTRAFILSSQRQEETDAPVMDVNCRGSTNGKDNWKNLLDAKNIYKLIYSLQIIESFLEDIEIDLLQCFGGLNLCHLGGSPFSAKTAMPCKSCKLINSQIYSDLNIIKFPEIHINI